MASHLLNYFCEIRTLEFFLPPKYSDFNKVSIKYRLALFLECGFWLDLPVVLWNIRLCNLIFSEEGWKWNTLTMCHKSKLFAKLCSTNLLFGSDFWRPKPFWPFQQLMLLPRIYERYNSITIPKREKYDLNSPGLCSNYKT